MTAIKTKVKRVQGNGTWNLKDGSLMYKYDYDFEDGNSITASHKSEGRFKEGDEVEYEVTHPDKNYGKVSKPSNFVQGGKKNDDYVKGIEVGHAVNNAVNMICAGVEFHDINTTNTDDKISAYALRIMEISDKLKSRR